MSHLYILSNNSMPGLLKIGLTNKSPYVRAKELYTTGVPEEFNVEAYWKIQEKQLSTRENQTHDRLAKFRPNQRREFFSLSVDQAKDLIQGLLQEKDILEKWRIKQKNEQLKKQKEEEEAKKREQKKILQVRKFVDLLNDNYEKIGHYIESILPAKLATKSLAKQRKERLIQHGKWLVIASHSYCGKSEKDHYLNNDNLLLYFSAPAITRRNFKTKNYPNGYFEFGFYLHSGELVFPEYFIRHSPAKDIITDTNIPKNLPTLLSDAGLHDISKAWNDLF